MIAVAGGVLTALILLLLVAWDGTHPAHDLTPHAAHGR